MNDIGGEDDEDAGAILSAVRGTLAKHTLVMS
jgi:hypothetical protein